MMFYTNTNPFTCPFAFTIYAGRKTIRFNMLIAIKNSGVKVPKIGKTGRVKNDPP
jgi:hypothetical protein